MQRDLYIMERDMYIRKETYKFMSRLLPQTRGTRERNNQFVSFYFPIPDVQARERINRSVFLYTQVSLHIHRTHCTCLSCRVPVLFFAHACTTHVCNETSVLCTETCISEKRPKYVKRHIHQKRDLPSPSLSRTSCMRT